VRRLGEWLDGVPVEYVYFPHSVAGMPGDLAVSHVELLASQVAPAIAATGR
jgi:hypothetical protein